MSNLTPIYENFFELTFVGARNSTLLQNTVMSYDADPITNTVIVEFDCFEETAKETIENIEVVKNIHVVIHDREGNTIFALPLEIQSFLGNKISQKYLTSGILTIKAVYQLVKKTNEQSIKLKYLKGKK